MVSKVDRLRCDACGIEIPVEAIVGLDVSEAMTAEQYMNQLHTAGFGLSARSASPVETSPGK
jgi:hypothetical protein